MQTEQQLGLPQRMCRLSCGQRGDETYRFQVKEPCGLETQWAFNMFPPLKLVAGDRMKKSSNPGDAFIQNSIPQWGCTSDYQFHWI